LRADCQEEIMSNDATHGQTPDIYGQLYPVETKELINQKRKEFEDELAKIPNDQKKCLLQAQEKCPQLLNDDLTLKFLRCEVFNADGVPVILLSTWLAGSAAICSLLGETSRNTYLARTKPFSLLR